MRLRGIETSDTLDCIQRAIQLLDLIENHRFFGDEYRAIIGDTNLDLEEAYEELVMLMEELRKYDYE